MKKKSIPVVYIITKLELGGAQKVCLSLFQGLLQHGSPAHLISGKEGPLVEKVSQSKNVVLLSSMQREVSFAAVWKEIKTFFALVKELRALRTQYPTLIAHTHSTKAGLIGRWAAWCAGIKHRVHTVHGYAFHEHQSWIVWTAIYLLELFTSWITTHFICVSCHDVKTGLRLFPKFAHKHSIIRAGVDTDTFYTPAISLTSAFTKQPFVFGTVSCFKPQKNLFDLLQAFKMVANQNPRARLEIIGDGMQRKEIEHWITENNLWQAITLHGWQQNVAAITKKWHAFALSSLWEGLPCAIVEARLQHLPIVSYDTGGISEVVIHNQNGFIVPQGNWMQLATYMKQLMTEQALYKKMQHYPDNLKDFNNDHMIQEHITLYKHLLQ